MSTVSQPSGTITLVFTDIEGSTALLEHLGVDAYRDALGQHRRIVREACLRYDGYEVDYEGDAFFYTFQSASNAVSAVTAFMTGLQDGPIRIRVGVHTGEPALDPPKYVGLDVHRAARIMSSAHGGQTLLSPTTVGLLEPASVQLKDLGHHRLKDLTAPIQLQQLQITGLPDEFPPLKTLYRSDLPVPATPFLGREQELAEVVERLTEPTTRLLTLTGPGGTGKTRLALQAAADVSDLFPDGVFWVPLAPLRDPALLLTAVAQAIEVSERADEQLAATIARTLLGKQILLLLDNLEHLLPAAATDLAALVSACPTLKLMVTSRERSHMQVETVWPVPTLSETDGERLFVERARAAGVELQVDATVSELCRRLDELPLAIELAAARARSLSPTAILDRLNESFVLLASRAPDVDERQRTLQATVAWSYDLLDHEEQRGLRALSVFAGGCTLDAALAVAGADLDVLESLLDKSLLRHRIDRAGHDRYWMLETIREYARGQLDEAREAEAVLDAHASWFCAFAEPLDGSPWSAPNERVDLFERELDNLRAAHELLAAQPDADRTLRLAVNLYPLWEMRDRIVEGDAWLERSLACAGHDGTVSRAQALAGRSALAYLLGKPDASQEFALASVEIMRVAGTDEQLGESLLAASWVARHEDIASARSTLQEALLLARRAGTPRFLRSVLHNLGEVERNAGSYDRAASLLEEAMTLTRELGDSGWEGAICHSLADVELDRGSTTVAWSRYLDAADLSLDQRIPQQLALCVGGLAAAGARLGHSDLAQRLWAALEQWENERGVRLQLAERARYEEALADLEPSPRVEPPLTLEQAIDLARASPPARIA